MVERAVPIKDQLINRVRTPFETGYKRLLKREINLIKELPAGQKPLHVVFIPDGNRRWEHDLGLPEGTGHKAGSDRLQEFMKIFGALDIPNITIWGLSRKNLSRSKKELDRICEVAKMSLETVLPQLKESNNRFIHIGNKENLPQDLVELFNRAEEETKDNTAHTLRLGFNYDETTEDNRLIKDVVTRVKKGEDLEDLTDDEARELRLESLSIFAGENIRDIQDPEERKRKVEEFEDMLVRTLVIRTGDAQDDTLMHLSGFGPLINHAMVHTIPKYLPATGAFDIIRGFKKYAKTQRRAGK